MAAEKKRKEEEAASREAAEKERREREEADNRTAAKQRAADLCDSVAYHRQGPPKTPSDMFVTCHLTYC